MDTQKSVNTEFVPNATGLIDPGCVLRVGEGRGFLVEYKRKNELGRRTFIRDYRFVITAAHCLPRIPRAFADTSETIYEGLLGSLGDTKNTIWAQCLFVDPIADIAVLGSVNDQMVLEQATAYDSFIDRLPSLKIGQPNNGQVWVLSLDGRWISSKAKVISGFGYGLGSVWIDVSEGGMSGSPILNKAGRAVGVMSCGTEHPQEAIAHGPQPILRGNLPAWLVQNSYRKTSWRANHE